METAINENSDDEIVELKCNQTSVAKYIETNTVTPSPLAERKHSKYDISTTDTNKNDSSTTSKCKKQCYDLGLSTGKCGEFQIIKTITVFLMTNNACMKHMPWVIYCDDCIYEYFMTIYITSLCAIFMHSMKY